MRRLLSIVASLALAACVAETDSASSDDEEIAAADAAIVAIAGRSQHVLYVRVPTKPSSALAAALIDAAKRGVDTRAVVASGGSFDSTWLFQQRLVTGLQMPLHPHSTFLLLHPCQGSPR